MDDDRKYRQRGYMDSPTGPQGDGDRLDRDLKRGPRPPIDVTGPRLPRLVQAVAAARCYNCATPLPTDFDFAQQCPKCNADLHCCKQCSYFEPSTRFQCMKPIPERIAYKDAANECTFFHARVTVARDSAPPPSTGSAAGRPDVITPKSANDARIAFDNLFKK